jgi:hypothetical protein
MPVFNLGHKDNHSIIILLHKKGADSSLWEAGRILKKIKYFLAESKKSTTFAIPFGKSQYEEGKTR